MFDDDVPATFANDLPAHRWREPSRSVASRRPSIKSSASCRPTLVTTEDRRELLCESELEAKAAWLLMARPDCARLYEQPEPVRFVDVEGVPRYHTFDFLMVRRDGRRIAVAVKPRAIAEKRGLRTLLGHIAGQMDPAFASGVLLLTDASMPRDDVANARLVHDARRLPDRDHDRRVRDVIATLSGTVAIADIIRAANLDGQDQAFYAVVRAIGEGLIATSGTGPIQRDTQVRRAPCRSSP